MQSLLTRPSVTPMHMTPVFGAIMEAARNFVHAYGRMGGAPCVRRASTVCPCGRRSALSPRDGSASPSTALWM